jgi:hypothetical protein
MAIENYPLNGDVSSPGLDSQHLDIACGASGADHRRNAGLGLFGLLFRIASWMASEVLAGCAAYAEAMYPMYTRQDEQPDSSEPAGARQTAEVVQIKRASESRNPADIQDRRGRLKSWVSWNSAAGADAAPTGAQRSSSMSETGDAQQIRAMPSAGGSIGSGE